MDAHVLLRPVCSACVYTCFFCSKLIFVVRNICSFVEIYVLSIQETNICENWTSTRELKEIIGKWRIGNGFLWLSRLVNYQGCQILKSHNLFINEYFYIIFSLRPLSGSYLVLSGGDFLYLVPLWFYKRFETKKSIVVTKKHKISNYNVIRIRYRKFPRDKTAYGYILHYGGIKCKFLPMVTEKIQFEIFLNKLKSYFL